MKFDIPLYQLAILFGSTISVFASLQLGIMLGWSMAGVLAFGAAGISLSCAVPYIIARIKNGKEKEKRLEAPLKAPEPTSPLKPLELPLRKSPDEEEKTRPNLPIAFCHNCGKGLDNSTYKHCTECGKPLREESRPNPENLPVPVTASLTFTGARLWNKAEEVITVIRKVESIVNLAENKLDMGKVTMDLFLEQFQRIGAEKDTANKAGEVVIAELESFQGLCNKRAEWCRQQMRIRDAESLRLDDEDSEPLMAQKKALEQELKLADRLKIKTASVKASILKISAQLDEEYHNALLRSIGPTTTDMIPVAQSVEAS